MPRVARIVIPGLLHHVTQRGNNRQDIFFVDDDRRAYLRLLKDNAERFGLEIAGWCLMTNHVHLLATPARPESLAKALGRTHFLYTLYVNRLHGRSGHLWQNRFYSAAVGDDHMLAVLRYIEQNPCRAGLARAAASWPWSSAAAHCGLAEDPAELLDLPDWRKRLGRADWNELLKEKLADPELSRIRLATHRGRPLAGDSLIAKLEQKLGQRLRALPRGRPRGRKGVKKGMENGRK